MPVFVSLKTLSLMLVISFGLVACQAPPDVQQLQDQNGSLQRQLDGANKKVSQLEASQTELKQEKAELNRVIGVLRNEKSSRVDESTNLRGDVRLYMQDQIDGLRQFLLKSNLLDYIGGELVERSKTSEEPELVVDLANVIPLQGTLTGVGAYFQAGGELTVKILRPIEEEMVVVWSSQPMLVTQTGMQRIQFPVSVGVDKGDILGYYFSTPKMVGFDTGTGKSRYLNEDVKVGEIIERSSLLGKSDRRSYSIGVFGLLTAQ